MYIPEDGWQLHPIAGSTGEAFVGIKENEKVFLKRNSSPFITALSAEGITPKLMWTQKTYSGDTLVAQEWKNGHSLTRQDMKDDRVKALIMHIHRSPSLLANLKRVGGRTCHPNRFIEDYFKDLSENLASHSFFNEVIQFLEDRVQSEFYQVDMAVCHGDLNHNNFLLDESQDRLYIVDWENVKIADPISDITYLLVQYFPPSQWMAWMQAYNFPDTPLFTDRVVWYTLINCLYLIKQYYNEGRFHKVNETVLLLKTIYESLTL